MKKAISLISGGLDSLLAAKLIMEQGIHVEGINFFTGFTGDHCHCLKPKEPGKTTHNAQWVCDTLGIKLHIINVVEEFKQILLNPQHGYGANLNPCLDCKLFMIQKAHQWVQENNFDFLITGEVLGQRPKSQRKDTLPIAAELTDDRIIRPLSAKLLKPTLPEREGWVNRELLCDFNGRNRKPQIELAHRFGFQEFPQPAGGCVLTESKFCNRLQDLIDHIPNKNYTLEQILLLRIGRHFRINNNLKVIVGRNDTENKFIETLQNKYKTLQCISHTGALVILDGEDTDENIKLCAQIAGHFSKGRDESNVTIQLYFPHDTINTITTNPINPDTMRL